MTNIKDLSFSELNEYFLNIGEKSFRAKQCFKWLSLGVSSFDEMTDISKVLKEKLKADFYISMPKIERKQVSKDGTYKYLFKNSDNTYVESVVMSYKHGVTICVSTQVGCNMGCKFCASTLGGKEKDLSSGEIYDQILFAQKDIGKRISNVVLMGMGEPLDNYNNVIKFLKTVNNENGLNISYRNITLSTCGVVPKIFELADEKLPITLTISLHATNDITRNRIMPINRKYNIRDLMQSLRHYSKVVGRRISFEYTLIDGVNDTKKDATELANLLRGFLCHVNLIPVNNVLENDFKKTKNVQNFKNMLVKLGINATIRRELGSDIDASCGQLRKNAKKGKE